MMDDVGLAGDASPRRGVMQEIHDLRLGWSMLLTDNLVTEDFSALFDDRVTGRPAAGHRVEAAVTSSHPTGL